MRYRIKPLTAQVLLCLIVFSHVGIGETIVNGDVSGEWSPEGNPYIIRDGANVPTGQMLIIQPGVHMIVQRNFVIHGAIQANGTERDSIIVRANPHGEALGESVFLFEFNGGNESRFSYVSIFNETGNYWLFSFRDGREDVDLVINNSYLLGDAGFTNRRCIINRLEISGSELIGDDAFMQCQNIREIVLCENIVHWARLRIDGGLSFILDDNRYISEPRLELHNFRNVRLTDNKWIGAVDEGFARDSIIVQVGDPSLAPRRDPLNAMNFLARNNKFITGYTVNGLNGSECLVENDTILNGCLRVRGFETTIVRNCHINGSFYGASDGNESTFVLENNSFLGEGTISIEALQNIAFSPVIRNNRSSGDISLWIYPNASPVVHGNTFGDGCVIIGANPNIHHNIFGNNTLDGTVHFREGASGVFTNNVVLVNRYGAVQPAIELRGESSPLIANNIIYHVWDSSGVGVRCWGEQGATIEHNVFYNFAESYLNCEPGRGNISDDPLLANVNNRDFRLLPNSPAIDAGHPDLPLDPDSTTADIGLLYYDQNHHNPPRITSDNSVLTYRGDTLHIEVSAVAESHSLSFLFDGLPNWLRLELRRDFVADSVYLTGIVPNDQENFDFLIICSDDEDFTDSLVVNVSISDYTLLSGRLNGVLSRAKSPYWITGPAWVESGDSLVIEPGCTICLDGGFSHYRRPNPSFIVYGYLGCVGTREDSIYFTSYYGDFVQTIQFVNSQDISEYAYTRNTNNPLGGNSIYVSSARVFIHNCIFTSNIYDYIGVARSWARFEDNIFYNYRSNSLLIGSESDIEILNNVFYSDTIPPYYDIETPYAVVWLDNCSVISNRNYFRNQLGSYYLHNGGSFASSFDIFDTKKDGLYLDCDIARFSHIYLSPTIAPSFQVLNCQVLVTNSIIVNSDTLLLNIHGDLAQLYLQNNLFMQADTTINEFLAGFGELQLTNDNGDSTDVYGNLFGNPGLIEIYPLEYRLGRGSRCINVGIAEEDEIDPDGSPPDIGPVPFNHENHPINIQEIIFPPGMQITVNEEINCSVDFFDTDQDDSSAFQWDIFRIVHEPDEEPADTIFLRRIGYGSEVGFVIRSIGTYQLRCIATDGYDIDTLLQEIEVLPNTVHSSPVNLPTQLLLHQNYPNPFNAATVISFDIPNREEVNIAVYDISGREVAVLANGHFNRGRHFIMWKAENLATGIYYCRLQTPEDTKTIPLTLIK